MRKEKTEAFNTKTKYRDTMEIDATALNLAKKTRYFPIANICRTCSNERSKKNKCNYGRSKSISRICA